MIRKKVTRNLKCKFTEAELKKIAGEMARAIHERDSAQEDLKSIKSQYDSKIKMAETAMKEAGSKLRTGYEFRNIDCELIENHDDGFITITRLDTFEIVEHVKIQGKHQLSIADDDLGEEPENHTTIKNPSLTEEGVSA